MILKPARLMLALLALVAAPVFAQTAPPSVNGKVIPNANAKIEQLVKQAVSQGKQTDSPELRAAIRRSLIGREVLVQAADKQGFGTRPEVKAALDNVRQTTIINAMLADHLRKNPFKEPQVKAEYERQKGLMGDKEYRARHILVKTEEEAKAIIVKLKAGSKFDELAKQFSIDGSKVNGGDLNWDTPANYVPEFSKAMVALQKGGVTDVPVKTENGFHVIKLEDTRPFKMPPYEEIKQQVLESMQRVQVDTFRKDLINKAVIK